MCVRHYSQSFPNKTKLFSIKVSMHAFIYRSIKKKVLPNWSYFNRRHSTTSSKYFSCRQLNRSSSSLHFFINVGSTSDICDLSSNCKQLDKCCYSWVMRRSSGTIQTSSGGTKQTSNDYCLDEKHKIKIRYLIQRTDNKSTTFILPFFSFFFVAKSWFLSIKNVKLSIKYGNWINRDKRYHC